MLTIHNAIATFVDESTETTADLHLDGGRVVAGAGYSDQPSNDDRRAAAGHSDPASNGDRRGPAGHSADSSDETLDATGCVVTPGLVNAHHHLLQSAFRTLHGTRGVPMASWLPTMAAAYAEVGIDPELEHAAALVGLAESLLCGVTTVADHHLNWPGGPGNTDNVLTVQIASAAAQAAAELGARLVFVRGSARDDAEQAALSAESIVQALVPGAEGGVRADGMLQVAVGPAGVHSDSPETFRLLAEVAERFGLRRRSQANEQVDVAIALEKYGRRPIDLLDDWGWLTPDVTLAHLCAVTENEIARLSAAGVTATHAPACDLPMGWGIAPVAALRASGIAVGLGTSGGGSNDASNLLADARLAMQVAPLVGAPIPARQILGMATRGSAAGLGRPELGSLTPGSAADLCVWDVTGASDAGIADPVAGLLWANPGRRPKHVVVAGRVVVRDYRLVAHDERNIAADLTTLLTARRPA
ncbi:amidohydrolase family protein [Subtercola boreus]|uniref:Hydroxyatrazine ethylaminohydrolase n=1 Tax=Subtercola boreus TaxID=120213 RepID=A0A3E0WBR1_9MICO|nr:amidohydrolase family protein [Subtercola boreus]RFA21999.1 hydroxyatrazine ethylaminohydrolase [Subtercola boreus]RFA22179.1 hydroxyatrazine ethylaminohydrolase [Subtercola boreus]RFA28041.1 hydroxyatrazine ethylaminohydrolase [Subtercola boreus]